MRTSSTISNLFIIFFFISSVVFSSLAAQCDPANDSLALVGIYHAMNGDNWDDNSNWLVEGQSIETWYGVTLNEEGCVTKLSFNSNNLVGEISPEIGNLSSLINLGLGENQLTGSIPSELGNLSNLSVLSMGHNQLTGDIPIELGNLSNLAYLFLRSNELTGNIPSELGALVNLTSINLALNQLSGSIPVQLGNLPSLRYLNLFGNDLTGGIPSEFGNLSNLIELVLQANPLSGNIPPELGNLSSLQILNLSGNELVGHIPIELTLLDNLVDLELWSNQLTGNIPAELGSLTNLELLDLRGNQLTGTIPSELSNLLKLNTLYLGSNELTGTIPSELGNLNSLIDIRLSWNDFSGTIPITLANLANLERLELNDNQLTGSIPPELGTMPNLRYLILSKNQLTGSIPIELADLINIRTLYASSNQLTGNLPAELGSLSTLRQLDFHDNRLTGKLPIELSNLDNLNTIHLRQNNFYGCFPPKYTNFCDVFSRSFSNNLGLENNGDFDAFCATGAGACNPTLIGNIIFDENQNCIEDDTDISLQNWLVRATSSSTDLFGSSNELGDYNIYTYPDSYQVELILPGPYWEEICTGIQEVNVIDSLSLDTINFLAQALVDCPFMTADISTPLLRRCFSNTYAVNYCNYGTVMAQNAYVEVQFDELINVDSTSIPIFDQIDNTMVFELGNVAANECGVFYIYTNVSCDASLEQTLCASTHIYPDSICAEISPEWSGATVAVEGFCDGDEVVFTLRNIGDGNMLENESYIVVEDGLILLSEPTPFILNSQGEMEVRLPANGSTYVCQASQVDNHPVASMPTAFVEACGVNGDGGFSTGFVTQFPEDDNAPFISIDCQEVIGSFDPNDKNASPYGFGEEHFIEKGQDIEYHIRFQNTGNDTAFIVMIEDAISPDLEMATFRQGTSSHPYHVEILGGDTLRFIFENILLVDSTTNEPASHGFVKFKISQKENLAIGTQIENTAGIYFDFNEAVITNTTWHTIGEDLIELIATSEPFINDLKVVLKPNPIVDESIILVSGVDFKNAQIYLFDILGRQLRQETFQGNELSLRKGELIPGIYLFEIKIDGRRGFVGKMTVQ